MMSLPCLDLERKKRERAPSKPVYQEFDNQIFDNQNDGCLAPNRDLGVAACAY